MSSSSSPTMSHSQPLPNPANVKQLVADAFSVLEQPTPPTLREILSAYRAKGDGDRDMLLAMLNAKTAEDQRIASVASLQRTLLEVYYQAPRYESQPPPINGTHHYPTPAYSQSPHLCERKSRRQHHSHHHQLSSGSRSPPRVRHHATSASRDAQPEHFPRKRQRSSMSPPSPRGYDNSQYEQLPPSPYSSSGRSDSAEYSPRSRASMAIGSLLSTGPNQEMNTEDP